jgi:hypothetical protein
MGPMQSEKMTKVVPLTESEAGPEHGLGIDGRRKAVVAPDAGLARCSNHAR